MIEMGRIGWNTFFQTAWAIALATLAAAVGSPAVSLEICQIYTVQSGDTLRKIAFHVYNLVPPDSWTLIRNANQEVVGVNADEIAEGTRLQIPCGDCARPDHPFGQGKCYIVQPGDTLQNVARKTIGVDDNVDWKRIFEANRARIGDNPDWIRAGLILWVPCKECPTTFPAITVQTSISSVGMPQPRETHVPSIPVPKGDSGRRNASRTTFPKTAASTKPPAGDFAPPAITARISTSPIAAPQTQATSISVSVMSVGNSAPRLPTQNATVSPNLPKGDFTPPTSAATVAVQTSISLTAAPQSHRTPRSDSFVPIGDSVKRPLAPNASHPTEPPAGEFVPPPMETAPQPQTKTHLGDRSVSEHGTSPASGPGSFALVTGNGFAPFTDESLPGRGFFTELVETAILRAQPELPYSIKFINDWGAHLDVLMPSFAFDASFPWTKPDCRYPELLSAAEQSRCDAYHFTDPFYEVVDGLFARKGSGFDNARQYTEFHGAVICQPDGYTQSHLDLAGLVEPTVEFLRPTGVAACFEMLMQAEVDVVSAEIQSAELAIAKLALRNRIILNPYLAAIKHLAIMVHKDNEQAGELLDLLNEGLGIMRESGEWRTIVTDALIRVVRSRS